MRLFSIIIGAALGAAYSLPSFNTSQTKPASSDFPHLLDATLDDLRSGLDSGLFTSVDLVKAYIACIHEVNPTLRAVIEINPDALSIAAELDAKRQRGCATTPLYGLPVLVKDVIATNDGMNTTAGSYALLGAKVPEDSTVITKLRKAGVIILGKANLSQWSSSRATKSGFAWSAYGGQVHGAYYEEQNPLGSSSGSAVAASIGLAWATLGTETQGSILNPADVSNTVGLKPTVGLTSRYLVIPMSQHRDTVGPIARTVKDAAYLLSAIAGRDAQDNYTSAIPTSKVPDYVGACKLSGLQGKRLGIARNLDTGSSFGREAFESALNILREAGAQIIDDLYLPGFDDFRTNGSQITTYTVAADLKSDLRENYFSKLTSNPNNITSLADLRAFTQNHPLEKYPEVDTGYWDIALNMTVDNTSLEAYDGRNNLEDMTGRLGLTGAMTNHSLDAIIAPTEYLVDMASVLGTPVITVPLGKTPENTTLVRHSSGVMNGQGPNMSFGLGFAGPKWSEEALIGMAYAFEQITQIRGGIKSYLQPSTELADIVQPEGDAC